MSLMRVEKSVGVRSLVILCMLLGLVLVMVTVWPLELLSSAALCSKATDLQASSSRRPLEWSIPSSSRLKVVPEWQSPTVVTDRESEKLDDHSYGEPHRFVPMGTATFLFVHFSTHRLEPDSFAVVGLGAAVLYLYNDPQFFCSWHPHNDPIHEPVHCDGSFIQPTQGHVSFGKEYVGTVVYCTFEQPVGIDGVGGHLVVKATHGTKYLSGLDDVSFVAKVEAPGEFNASHFRPPYRFDHVHCGGPLYGPLNPQRIREWIAYHVQFLGDRSHFFMYDAGGVDTEVHRVLAPWVALGRITIVNARQAQRYNSHYHCQFVFLNDCLFRSRTLAPWTWIFDVDEYAHIHPRYSDVDQVINEIEESYWGKRLQRISMVQKPMDFKHCLRQEGDSNKQESAWAIEKMVYKRTQVIELGGWMDRKSVVRADSALAVGPHEPVRMRLPPGATDVTHVTSWEGEKLQYYHYRGSASKRESEVCQELLERHVNVTSFDDVQHQLDESMVVLAEKAKRFEQETIGSDSIHV